MLLRLLHTLEPGFFFCYDKEHEVITNMNTTERRAAIQAALAESSAPLSASVLAARFSVSRQVVVGDIALLRAGGLSVLATPRGYIIEPASGASQGYEKSIVCAHADDRLAEELYMIVDLGGAILDVTVEHSVYGEITAPLRIFSRYDVDLFVKKLQASGARPLCNLTDGVHLHRIRVEDAAAFSRIEHMLAEKELLFPR